MPDQPSITTIGSFEIGQELELTLRSNGDVLLTVYTPYTTEGVAFEVHSVFKTKLSVMSQAIARLNDMYVKEFETTYVPSIKGENDV